MSYVASYLCIAAVSLHLVSMAFSIFKCKGVIRLMFVVKGDDIVIFMIFYGYFAKNLSHHYYFIDLQLSLPIYSSQAACWSHVAPSNMDMLFFPRRIQKQSITIPTQTIALRNQVSKLVTLICKLVSFGDSHSSSTVNTLPSLDIFNNDRGLDAFKTSVQTCYLSCEFVSLMFMHEIYICSCKMERRGQRSCCANKDKI